MYHEEEIIDGILCHRGTPGEEWEPYTPEALTIALTAERTQNKENLDGWMAADAKLREIRLVVERLT